LQYDAPSAWHSQEWAGANANFAEHAPNHDYVLIRGHQLDGPNKLRNGEGYLPPMEYRLDPYPSPQPTG
jgi:hypothetical protein